MCNSTASKQLLARVPLGWKLDAMTQSDDMCTPEEYLAIYDRPIDFTLGITPYCRYRFFCLSTITYFVWRFMITESERVWPVEPFLKY
jgi:hypothetical protein